MSFRTDAANRAADRLIAEINREKARQEALLGVENQRLNDQFTRQQQDINTLHNQVIPHNTGLSNEINQSMQGVQGQVGAANQALQQHLQQSAGQTKNLALSELNRLGINKSPMSFAGYDDQVNQQLGLTQQRAGYEQENLANEQLRLAILGDQLSGLNESGRNTGIERADLERDQGLEANRLGWEDYLNEIAMRLEDAEFQRQMGLEDAALLDGQGSDFVPYESNFTPYSFTPWGSNFTPWGYGGSGFTPYAPYNDFETPGKDSGSEGPNPYADSNFTGENEWLNNTSPVEWLDDPLSGAYGNLLGFMETPEYRKALERSKNVDAAMKRGEISEITAKQQKAEISKYVRELSGGKKTSVSKKNATSGGLLSAGLGKKKKITAPTAVVKAAKKAGQTLEDFMKTPAYRKALAADRAKKAKAAAFKKRQAAAKKKSKIQAKKQRALMRKKQNKKKNARIKRRNAYEAARRRKSIKRVDKGKKLNKSRRRLNARNLGR